jgi:hypothetical protein
MANIKGRCEPAYNVIVRLGGVIRTAKVCGVHQSTVSRWLVWPVHGGTGGLVPQRHWETIVAYAKKKRIKLDLHDLSGIAKK